MGSFRPKKIVIIHFNPVELYPPVQNFLRYAAKRSGNDKVYVFTTALSDSPVKKFHAPGHNIRIIHLGRSGAGMAAFSRYMNFIFFYAGAVCWLLFKNPDSILYYETLSSFPAYIYKKFIKRSAAILVHYHEYTSPAEYANGSSLLKFFHKLERFLYPKAAWVSHTNEYRMEHFIKDIYPAQINVKKILPNYPPAEWNTLPKKQVTEPVRIVYVGALSMQTMYTKEFALWVIRQKGKVTWDIYSYNAKEDAASFLKAVSPQLIQLKGGINYEQLPAILKDYDVGVVLYNGHIPNYVYNAPNKLFEYLACGLDVWFPSVMLGSLPYITEGLYPKVIAADFTDLVHFDLDKALDKQGYDPQPVPFFCENVLGELYEALS